VRQDLTDMTKEPWEMVVTEVQENEDGGATITFDLDAGATKAMTNIGLQFVLYCAAAGVDMQDALDGILASNPATTPA
jgi:hypothetical protein